MFELFADTDHLTCVFEKFTLNQAILVRKNIQSCITKLKLPSDTLFRQMLAEGLTFTPSTPLSNQNISNSVIRVLMSNTFLDEKKLFATLSCFNLPEQMEIKRAIAEGKYPLDPEAIADKMVSLNSLLSPPPGIQR